MVKGGSADQSARPGGPELPRLARGRSTWRSTSCTASEMSFPRRVRSSLREQLLKSSNSVVRSPCARVMEYVLSRWNQSIVAVPQWSEPRGCGRPARPSRTRARHGEPSNHRPRAWQASSLARPARTGVVHPGRGTCVNRADRKVGPAGCGAAGPAGARLVPAVMVCCRAVSRTSGGSADCRPAPKGDGIAWATISGRPDKARRLVPHRITERVRRVDAIAPAAILPRCIRIHRHFEYDSGRP
jgi:hypothetical protein